MIGDAVEIVIVEDTPSDAELIARVFKKYHLANRFVILNDGADALDFLFAQGRFEHRSGEVSPRVVFLDLKLPKIDGIEVLRRLKSDERTRKIPVVVVSSSSEAKDLKDAWELGVNSYVTKPIRYEEFAKVMADLGLYWLVINKLAA